MPWQIRCAVSRRDLPRIARRFVYAWRHLVAQSYTLPYRRVALYQSSGKLDAWDQSDALPNAIRRYSRLKICATAVRPRSAKHVRRFNPGDTSIQFESRKDD